MAAPTAAMRWRRPPGAAGGSGGRWSCQARARCASTARARSARPWCTGPPSKRSNAPGTTPPATPRPSPPDDPVDLRLAQEQTVLELWQATRASGNELLLELIPPCLQPPADAGPQTHASAEDEVVLRAVKRFYNLGVKPEWWQLAPMRPEGWSRLAALIAERDSHCRGAVILGLNQPLAYLADSFRAATDPAVKGFMVGRTLWAQAALQWLRGQIDDQALTDAVADNFARLVQAGQQRLDSPANTSIPTTTEA